MTEYKVGQVYEDSGGYRWMVLPERRMHLQVGDGWSPRAADAETVEKMYGPLRLVSGADIVWTTDQLGVADDDPVNRPKHYTWLPNGIEVIDITELFNFRVGNALKYILRHLHKGDPINDLKKAIWYLQREVSALEKSSDHQ